MTDTGTDRRAIEVHGPAMPEVYRSTAVSTGDGRNGHSRTTVAREQGEHLLAQAHQRCPYSKATRNNIDVQLVLNHIPEEATV